MKKNLMFAVVAVATTLGTLSSAHAQSVELKVTGTVQPPACLPTLSSDTVSWNYTAAGVALLPTNTGGAGYPQLPTETVNFRIDCRGVASRVAIKFTDNRAGSQMTEATGKAATESFGLGVSSGTKVGSYMVEVANADFATEVGAAVVSFATTDTDAAGTWRAPTLVTRADHSGWLYSWGASVSTPAPIAAKMFDGKLRVTPWLNKALTYENEVELDGAMTITLEYL